MGTLGGNGLIYSLELSNMIMLSKQMTSRKNKKSTYVMCQNYFYLLFSHRKFFAEIYLFTSIITRSLEQELPIDDLYYFRFLEKTDY